jgi:predicted peptidase
MFPTRSWFAAAALATVCGISSTSATLAASPPDPVVAERQAAHAEILPLSVSYLLYLPPDYAKATERKWPLLLFLHGSGESGDDLAKVKAHGPPKLIEAGREFPFILASPQAKTFGWDPTILGALLDRLEAQYRVDRERIYVTGLSMGGHGTWALAAAFPGRFAAIAPVCGYLDGVTASRWRDLPIWAFHGAKDTVVPPEATTSVLRALKDAGAKNVKLTLYDDVGHDAWTRTYEDPEFWRWLVDQARTPGNGDR